MTVEQKAKARTRRETRAATRERNKNVCARQIGLRPTHYQRYQMVIMEAARYVHKRCMELHRAQPRVRGAEQVAEEPRHKRRAVSSHHP